MNRQFMLYVALFISVFLFGCSSRHVPAPVSSLNNNVNESNHLINIAGGKYTVQKGDTLYSITRTYKMSLNDVKKLNPGLTANLSLGQRIRVK